MSSSDNIHTETTAIKEPPTGIISSLRFLGPGLILSAAIVGSGELIATTNLGAEAGFILLWVVLFGCLIKVAVQVEHGKNCIIHGKPSFQSWNRGKSLKLFGIHWTVYSGVLYLIATFFGQGGVLGGSAQVAAYAFPVFRLEIWLFLLVIVIALLVFHGKYKPVEWIATALNFIFIATVLYCVIAIQWTPYAYSFTELASGFTFHLPSNLVAVALGAFGITGVAAGETVMYTYWCWEKGYAAWTGPRDGTPEWYQRARGWTRVMIIDAIVSMVVYTVTTCAFYILGAAVLQAQETLADGNDFIFQLSSIFTEVLGEGSRVIFMLCAFTVLFSTIFANTAGFSRVWTDFFGLCKLIDWNNIKQRRKSVAVMAWVFPLTCGLIYFFIQKPLFLVIFMGIANSIFLLVVAWQAIVFRYRQTDDELKPSKVYDVILWLSILSIAYLAWRSVF